MIYYTLICLHFSMDPYDIIQITKAALSVMISNVLLYNVIDGCLLSSLDRSDHFKVETCIRTYFLYG